MAPVLTRGLVAGAAAAAIVAGGAGVANAATGDEPAGYRSVADYARSVLTGPGGLVVLANVTAFDGAAPAADVAIYTSGYLCRPTFPVSVTLAELESATADGAGRVECTPVNDPEDDYPDGGPVRYGSAVVDITWTGVGPQIHEVFTGNRMHCVGLILEREVALSGGVTLDVRKLYRGGTTDAMSYTGTALRHEEVACPPALG